MKALRILDFDIENRPLSYWVPDRPSTEVTAIAWAWADKPKAVNVVLLGRQTMVEMLSYFVEAYNEAEMVTGHYIRRHDLPILNGACMENGFPMLGPKLTCDTKLDMVRKADIPATQEFLSDMLDIKPTKHHMTQTMWREANRLTEAGISLTAKRVMDDVTQHMALRLAMVDAEMLHPPKMWRA